MPRRESRTLAAASLDGLVAAAAEELAGFRLLFHHAAREPEFRKDIDELRACMFDVAHGWLADAPAAAVGDESGAAGREARSAAARGLGRLDDAGQCSTDALSRIVEGGPGVAEQGIQLVHGSPTRRRRGSRRVCFGADRRAGEILGRGVGSRGSPIV